jgi:hypothetical protein
VAEFQDRERRADDVDPPGPAQRGEEILQRGPGDDVVEVLRRALGPVEPLPELIANPPPNGIDRSRGQGSDQNIIERMAHGRAYGDYRLDAPGCRPGGTVEAYR